MQDLRNKYERSIIKLGNSKAITFPQEWTNRANLKEKSIVNLYPVDDKTIIIEEEQKTTFHIDGNSWPIKLIRQAILSAFKLNVDQIYLKYNDKNQDALYQLVIEMQREIIGFDFKLLSDTNEYYINFLLDTSIKPLLEVLKELSNIFKTIIKNIIEGSIKKNYNLLLIEIDRKYSLGTRILIVGLSEFPVSKGYQNMPVIRFLGDRVVLLYIRDFINEALNLQHLSIEIIKKYSEFLMKIPDFLLNIVENYNNVNLESLSNFQEFLINLESLLENIKFETSNHEELQIRSSIKYYLNSLENFFDIGITRLIESEIGLS
jgi:bifunctional DNA-binding transcriptional regulator/antitoxin component of YhaV-PrlF toxin-antitoxin module